MLWFQAVVLFFVAKPYKKNCGNFFILKMKQFNLIKVKNINFLNFRLFQKRYHKQWAYIFVEATLDAAKYEINTYQKQH